MSAHLHDLVLTARIQQSTPVAPMPSVPFSAEPSPAESLRAQVTYLFGPEVFSLFETWAVADDASSILATISDATGQPVTYRLWTRPWDDAWHCRRTSREHVADPLRINYDTEECGRDYTSISEVYQAFETRLPQLATYLWQDLGFSPVSDRDIFTAALARGRQRAEAQYAATEQRIFRAAWLLASIRTYQPGALRAYARWIFGADWDAHWLYRVEYDDVSDEGVPMGAHIVAQLQTVGGVFSLVLWPDGWSQYAEPIWQVYGPTKTASSPFREVWGNPAVMVDRLLAALDLVAHD